MKTENRNKSIFGSNGILWYTITVFAFGAALILGFFYAFFIRQQISFELQLTLIFALLIEIIAISLNLALIRLSLMMKVMEEKNRLLLESNKETGELNNKLRAQRHDFLNHIQVIHGLMEIEHFKDAAKYMEKTYNEIQSVTKVLQTSSPAINAILQIKQNTCDDQKITFKVLTSSKLEHLTIDVWDLCAILANLIDNAINAVKNTTQKKITVLIKEDLYYHIIKVKDSGHGISEENITRIFSKGFTTKIEEGHGVGLYASKEKTEAAGGEIFFETSVKGTIFTVKIPKKTV